MMGDYHVRFCERFGVKFPLPTWLCFLESFLTPRVYRTTWLIEEPPNFVSPFWKAAWFEKYLGLVNSTGKILAQKRFISSKETVGLRGLRFRKNLEFIGLASQIFSLKSRASFIDNWIVFRLSFSELKLRVASIFPTRKVSKIAWLIWIPPNFEFLFWKAAWFEQYLGFVDLTSKILALKKLYSFMENLSVCLTLRFEAKIGIYFFNLTHELCGN